MSDLKTFTVLLLQSLPRTGFIAAEPAWSKQIERQKIGYMETISVLHQTAPLTCEKHHKIPVKNYRHGKPGKVEMTRYQTGFETGKPSLKPACLAKSTDKNVILYCTNLHIYNNARFYSRV